MAKQRDWATDSLYTIARSEDRSWSAPHRITVEDPFTRVPIEHLRLSEHLSLSPDGNRLSVHFWVDEIPKDWEANPWVQEVRRGGNSSVRIMALYDIESHKTSLGWKNLFPDSMPVWSKDGLSFLIAAKSPVGSTWVQDDIRGHRTSGNDANVFYVDLRTGNVEQIARNIPEHHEAPLLWRDDGDVVIHTANASITRLHRAEDGWHYVDHIALPRKGEDRFRYLVSDGRNVYGVHESISSPQNIFRYKANDVGIKLISNLNSGLDLSRFASVKSVSWNTPGGATNKGLLFVPPGYIPGKRYPLVIQAKGDQGWFTCDSGFNHDPSFAPQPIATAGIMYLVRTAGEDFNLQDEIALQPKGYPGQIGEAVQALDEWDSAVDELNRQGLIDPDKVGIIGFSRTGFYVDFNLVHARTKYAAATTTDNVQYSLSEYWLIPAFASSDEAMYGGPPYGATLENWKRYSISFNLEKVHTPLLMEEMGYGVHDDTFGAQPVTLAACFEILQGLEKLKRPVELYYYPEDEHQPDHPRARLATLQRNVDWYRFWLQDYERPNPEDPDQYKRWEHLRELRDADASVAPDEGQKGSAN
jgi:dipeptidyl aminopeptidase/acylaminoacyl peptidase